MPGANQEWQNRTRGLLRSEMARRNISNRQLVELLAEIGIKESEKGLSNKLIRGTFSAIFLLQCLDVIGCRVLRLKEDE
jgi:hypothetical protein